MNKTMQRLDGIALAPGIAIGKVLPLHSSNRTGVPEKRAISDAEAEITRFSGALKVTCAQLESLRDELVTRLQERESGIFDAHIMICRDQAMINDVEKNIRENSCCAEYATWQVSERYAEVLQNLEDDYLRERAIDIRDVASRVIANLTDSEIKSLSMDDRRIIASHTLVPSETATLDKNKILGLVVETGGVTSHTAILARSLALPAVAGIPGAVIDQLQIDDRLIVDGFAGKVIVNPDGRTEES
ncbi:MAG: phosphoenolpyruvate--protein phosphotransferase, partial [Lentisphaeria bacterium]|nr:phosphoenolpyruvate--protein phosphotransferase [Lentisphaeria bacterium]